MNNFKKMLYYNYGDLNEWCDPQPDFLDLLNDNR